MSTYTCRTNASCAREPYSSSVYSFFEGLKSQTFIPACAQHPQKECCDLIHCLELLKSV